MTSRFLEASMQFANNPMICCQDTQEYRAICLSLVQCGRNFGAAFEDDLLDTFCGSLKGHWWLALTQKRSLSMISIQWLGVWFEIESQRATNRVFQPFESKSIIWVFFCWVETTRWPMLDQPTSQRRLIRALRPRPLPRLTLYLALQASWSHGYGILTSLVWDMGKMWHAGCISHYWNRPLRNPKVTPPTKSQGELDRGTEANREVRLYFWMSLLAMAQVKAGVPPGCTNDTPGLWFLKFFARTALASMSHRDDKYIYIYMWLYDSCLYLCLVGKMLETWIQGWRRVSLCPDVSDCREVISSVVQNCIKPNQWMFSSPSWMCISVENQFNKGDEEKTIIRIEVDLVW